MKNQTSKIVSATCILFLVFAFTIQQEKKFGTLDIKSSTNNKMVEANLQTHKPFDVEVYSDVIGPMGKTYQVIYYRNENGKLEDHQALPSFKQKYNKADYKWLNDTAIEMRFYGTKTKKEETITFFGRAGSSGMTRK